MPNGVDLILADHQAVRGLFAQFDETGNASSMREAFRALTAHDDAEHAALYPMAWTILGDPILNQRCQVAHSRMRTKIEAMLLLQGERLIDEFRVLRDLVTEHFDDEERNMLAALSERASPQQLDVLGARILRARHFS